MKIQNQLGYIKGITFAPFHKRGSLSTQTARDSFDYMIEHTAADFVILAPAGLQEHAHSEEICYTSSATFSDEELINMIRYAKSKSIRVALKRYQYTTKPCLRAQKNTTLHRTVRKIWDIWGRA